MTRNRFFVRSPLNGAQFAQAQVSYIVKKELAT